MRRLLAVLALAALAACATVSRAPELSLASIDLLEVGLIEQRLGLRLRVQNPNDGELRIDGLSYALEVNGRPFARGVSAQSVTVPRYGEAMLDVSAVSNLSLLLRQLGAVMGGEREALEYRLTGSAQVAGLGSVPFDHRGEMTLPFNLKDFGS